MRNSMKLTFAALPENEALARMAISAFILPVNPTLEQLADVKTAVSEAVTNAIIHGYENRSVMVRLDCTIENDVFTAVIHDDGVGIGDVEQARQPFYTTKPELERSGMGFTVMEAFMEEVAIESAVGSGTTVTLKKRIGRRNEA